MAAPQSHVQQRQSSSDEKSSSGTLPTEIEVDAINDAASALGLTAMTDNPVKRRMKVFNIQKHLLSLLENS